MFDFSFAIAESPRDCPQGSVFVDEPVEGIIRLQVVGGAQDGHTVYAAATDA